MLNDLINRYYDDLNENDLHILSFISKNIDTTLRSTLVELSTYCNVSSSTISRTAQKLGFEGFTQFKYFLVKERERIDQEARVNTGSFKSSILLNDFAQTVKFFEQNNSLTDIFELMIKSKRIFAYGTGHSQSLMIEEFARCLWNIGIFINIIPTKTELDLVSDSLNDNDLLYVVGLSGNIERIKPMLNTLVVK